MVIGKVKIDPGSYLVPNVVSLEVVHDDHGQHGHLPGHEEDVVLGNRHRVLLHAVDGRPYEHAAQNRVLQQRSSA